MKRKDYQLTSSMFYALTGTILFVLLLCSPAETIAKTKKSDQPKKTEAIVKVVKPILNDLESLIKDYYPRAKVVVNPKSLDVKFKFKNAISVYTKRPELMPKDGGLLCQVKLKSWQIQRKSKARC